MTNNDDFRITFPLLIESNLEVDMMLPNPLFHFYASSPIFNASSQGKTTILCTSAFEMSYIATFATDLKSIFIDSSIIGIKPVLVHNTRFIISDLCQLVDRDNLSDLVSLLQDLEEQNIRNVVFIIKSDLISDMVFLSGLRRLFPSHLLLSKYTANKILALHQYTHKGGIRSEKKIINLISNKMELFQREDVLPIYNFDNKEETALPSSSFALNTSSEQKIQRSEVQLPFLKAQTNNLIEYVPDDADDMDEEDPDADLEF